MKLHIPEILQAVTLAAAAGIFIVGAQVSTVLVEHNKEATAHPAQVTMVALNKEKIQTIQKLHQDAIERWQKADERSLERFIRIETLLLEGLVRQ